MTESNKRAKLPKDEEKRLFVLAFQPLVTEVLDQVRAEYPDYDAGAIQWLKESMEYNCPGGKMNRGISVVATFRTLVGGRDLTEDELKKTQLLGWCVEWLQAFFLVSDDIMDGSVTRRGQPCWYKQEKVGMVAINDAFLIESAIYKLLRNHFKGTEVYVELLELFHETTWQTELGQMLDLITAPEDKVDLSKFSIAKYNCIVKYKTAFYSFYLPVALAMILHGTKDESKLADAKAILLEMGEFFQIQDDYLDCYGDPETIGKIGTDIEDNKCGWLIVQALDRCTPEQRAVLESNYAQKDPAKVKRVKELYKELELEKLFFQYEEASYARLLKLIDERAGDLPKAIFTDFADKIYKRKK